MLYKCKNELCGNIVFWSNCCGDLHHNGEYQINSVEELPKELQRAYKELWAETYGVHCYLVEFKGRYGIAFEVEYDDNFACDLGISYEEAVGLAEDMAKNLALHYPYYDVIFGEDALLWSNGSRSTTVLVVTPWTTSKKKLDELGKYMNYLAENEGKTENFTVGEYIRRTLDSYVGLTIRECKGEELQRKFTAEAHEWNSAVIPDDILNKEVKSITQYYDQVLIEVER